MPEGRQYLWFEYYVVRAWHIPVGAVLAGGLGTLPLAPLADVAQAELPGVIRQMEARIRSAGAPEARCGGRSPGRWKPRGCSGRRPTC